MSYLGQRWKLSALGVRAFHGRFYPTTIEELVGTQHFASNGMPERGRIYNDGDQLSMNLAYNAPGCTDVAVTFKGDFVPGSPWHDQFCAALPVEARESACDEPVAGHFPSDRYFLSSGEGELAVTAKPGAAPIAEPSSPPPGNAYPTSLEGFKLCSILVRLTDQEDFPSWSEQEIHVDCRDAGSYFGR